MNPTIEINMSIKMLLGLIQPLMYMNPTIETNPTIEINPTIQINPTIKINPTVENKPDISIGILEDLCHHKMAGAYSHKHLLTPCVNTPRLMPQQGCTFNH